MITLSLGLFSDTISRLSRGSLHRQRSSRSTSEVTWQYQKLWTIPGLGARGTVQIETLSAIPIETFIRTIGKKTK